MKHQAIQLGVLFALHKQQVLLVFLKISMKQNAPRETQCIFICTYSRFSS